MSERDLTTFRRRRIGIVFQQYNLIPTMTALENVALPAMLDGMPPDQRRERAGALLAQLELTHRSGHRPDALSGGEQQRVALARAMVLGPEVLFADEPTGNVDSATSAQIWARLARLPEETGMTVLMVTHEAAAAAHCRRVFLLRDGRIQESIDVDGLDASELAARAL